MTKTYKYEDLVNAITNEYKHQAHVQTLLDNANELAQIEKNLQSLYFVLYDEYQVDYDDLKIGA